MASHGVLLIFRPRLLAICLAYALGSIVFYANAEEVQPNSDEEVQANSTENMQFNSSEGIEFNTDVLDVKDRENIDLGQFSQGGYIMPGDYAMIIRINKQELPEQLVLFYPPDNDPKGSEACVSLDIVKQFGFKPEILKKLSWWHQGQCLLINSLPGITARADLGTSSLTISLPQAYLEYHLLFNLLGVL